MSKIIIEKTPYKEFVGSHISIETKMALLSETIRKDMSMSKLIRKILEEYVTSENIIIEETVSTA